MVNYYKVLGIKETASPQEIRDAFRNIVKDYHFDKVDQTLSQYPHLERIRKDADEKCKLVIEAHHVLSDPFKRKKHDEELKQQTTNSTTSKSNAPSTPLLMVNKTLFEYKGMKQGTPIYDSLAIFNKGDGVLTGKASSNKNWVKLSNTVINTPDYQDIGMEIDTNYFSPGESGQAVIEIRSNGGDKIIRVKISINSCENPFAPFIAKLSNVNWRRWLSVGLAALLLLITIKGISLLTKNKPIDNRLACANKEDSPSAKKICRNSQNSSIIINKADYNDEQSPDEIQEIDQDFMINALEGNWFGTIDGSRKLFLTLGPVGYQMGGAFYTCGSTGEICAWLKSNNEVILKIDYSKNVFKNQNNLGKEFIACTFHGHLKNKKIEGEYTKKGVIKGKFEMEQVFDPYNADKIIQSLFSGGKDINDFRIQKTVYKGDFEKAWLEACRNLDNQEIEIIDLTNRLIITKDKIIQFEEKGKETEKTVRFIRN